MSISILNFHSDHLDWFDSLGAAGQRELGHVFVGDLQSQGFSSGAAVSQADLDSSLDVDVWDVDLGGEHISVPVVFHCHCCLYGFGT